MGVYEQLPYTNFHDLNLDWIIKKLENIEDPTTEADRAEAAADAAALSASSADDDASAAAAALASIQTAIQDAAAASGVSPEPVSGITEYEAGHAGRRLFQSLDTIVGQIQLHIIGEVTSAGLLATNFPAPAGGAYTIIGHHLNSAKLGQVVLGHLTRSADETYTTANALHLLTGTLEEGDRVVFDLNYCTRT